MGALRQKAVGLVLLFVFTAPQTLGSICAVRCAPAVTSASIAEAPGGHQGHHANDSSRVRQSASFASPSPALSHPQVGDVPAHTCADAHGTVVDATEVLQTVRANKRALTDGQPLGASTKTVFAFTSSRAHLVDNPTARNASRSHAPLVLRI